jgi:hypothetical protein
MELSLTLGLSESASRIAEHHPNASRYDARTLTKKTRHDADKDFREKCTAGLPDGVCFRTKKAQFG